MGTAPFCLIHNQSTAQNTAINAASEIGKEHFQTPPCCHFLRLVREAKDKKYRCQNLKIFPLTHTHGPLELTLYGLLWVKLFITS